MHIAGYQCTLCNAEFAYIEDMLTCPHCGEKGILDIQLDYKSLKLEFSRDTLNADRTNSMWRYRALLPVEGEGWEKYLRVGFTPLYRSCQLEKRLGAKALYIKDEGINPTSSLKDRASAVAVMRARELGFNAIACASAGDAACSLACNAARGGIQSVIFVPAYAPKEKVAQLLAFGANVIRVEGDDGQTFALSGEAIEKWSFYNRNAGVNPILIEGKKTVALEIAEQLIFQPTDWVAVSVGDGCTISGVYKGFADLHALGMIERMPRLLGVQAASCAPFVEAVKTGCTSRLTEGDTLAGGVAEGMPRNHVKALRAVEQSGGAWLALEDGAILTAMRELGQTEGIFCDRAGAAAIAGVRAALELGMIRPDESVTAICTGNGLKDVQSALLAAGETFSCAPDIVALEKSGRMRAATREERV